MDSLQQARHLATRWLEFTVMAENASDDSRAERYKRRAEEQLTGLAAFSLLAIAEDLAAIRRMMEMSAPTGQGG
jgi:hypothetical protein